MINGRDSGWCQVNAADGHYLLDAAALRRTGVRLRPPDGSRWMPCPGRADYDSASQQLHLQVPPDWLPGSASTIPDWSPAPPARSLGALFSYDLYYSAPPTAPRPGFPRCSSNVCSTASG